MKIMVSACLLGENCKYNGGNNKNEKFKELLFSNLDFAKEYMLSSPDAYVAGTKIGLRGLVDKASLIDKALIKGYKAKFVSIDAAGNVIYDYSAIEQALNRCSTMDEYEFAALLSVFDDMGVCYGTNPYPGDIAYQIEQNLRAQMNIQVIGSDGFYNTPYDNLTYEQRAIYVMAYGDLYPEHMQKMDRLLSNMPTGTTTDVDGNPHSYEEDYYNICFLSFTGEEPEKTVFFKYIDEIVVEDWEYQGNDYWGRDYYVDPKSVHYTLSGYVNDNGYPVKTGANDPRGPYVIFFHEIGHAIDDLMADGIAGFSYKSEQVGLSDVIIECVKQDAMSRLNTISNLNDDEKIDIVELFVGPKINPDNLKYNSWNSNVQQAYNDLIDSYYTGQLNWSNLNVYSYECLTDVYFGCIDNKVEFGKYIMHRDDYYWYSKYGGDMLESIGREFDAEMFSYGMTHSPYNQINSVVYDMNLGEPEPGIFYDAYEAYNKMMEEEANKS